MKRIVLALAVVAAVAGAYVMSAKAGCTTTCYHTGGGAGAPDETCRTTC